MLKEVRWGLPPQVRGTLVVFANVEVVRRLTPAGAGNTWIIAASTMPKDGLPPQVRGTLWT